MLTITPAQIQAQWIQNINAWVADYDRVNKNALTAEWFVSPLEYFWPDGRQLQDKVFAAAHAPNSNFDTMASPQIYLSSMKADFRAKMMVFAFMRQPIAKTFGLEIENGLMHLYRLDFLSCLNQWIYVIEGYARKLFKVTNSQSVKSHLWTHPSITDPTLSGFVTTISNTLAKYLDEVVFKSTSDALSDRLRRHIVLHGNQENKDFYSQKNCLLLMFLLDALVTVEMIMNKEFPQVFQEKDDEARRIQQRKVFYVELVQSAFGEENLRKLELLEQHR